MKRRVLALTASLIFVVSGIMVPWSVAAGQEPEFPPLRGFEIVQEYPVYTPDDLWDYINGAADSYLSFGFEELFIAEYKKGKKFTVKAEVYSHITPEMAFGIYAMERAPGYNFVKAGMQGYSAPDHFFFAKGNYYVKVTTNATSKKAVAAVKDVALALEASIEGTSEMPATLDLFPEAGKLQNEELFIAEGVLGYSYMRKAYRARYETDGKDFYIYIFNHADEAANRAMLKEYLGRQAMGPDDSADGRFFFTDGYTGEIFLGWKENMTVLVNGLKADDAALAGDYIDKILK
jgi:hypothetical protein